MSTVRHFLLAGVALWPLGGHPAWAQEQVAARQPAAIQVRTGQHADRGRVVLHLGQVPAYSMRKVENGYELHLRGRYPLDFSAIRRLSQLAGIESRQEGGDTVVMLRTAGEQVAEAGSFDGMLYVDLRPTGTARVTNTREAAQRRLLDDAVRLGLMKPEQAEAMLQAAQGGPAAPMPRPAAAEPARRAAAARRRARARCARRRIFSQCGLPANES